MRLTRTDFDVRVRVTDDGRIILSLGLIAGEISRAETLELGNQCANAVERAAHVIRGGDSG